MVTLMVSLSMVVLFDPTEIRRYVRLLHDEFSAVSFTKTGFNMGFLHCVLHGSGG
jgi:hypothetical protein